MSPLIGKVNRGGSFSSTIRYVLADKKKAKVVFANFVEALQDNVDNIVETFNSQAIFNHRVKKPVYHLSVSPAINDSLSEVDWSELASGLIDELGLNNHQAIAVLHQDTYFPNSNKLRKHIHRVANAVGDDAKCGNFLL